MTDLLRPTAPDPAPRRPLPPPRCGLAAARLRSPRSPSSSASSSPPSGTTSSRPSCTGSLAGVGRRRYPPRRCGRGTTTRRSRAASRWSPAPRRSRASTFDLVREEDRGALTEALDALGRRWSARAAPLGIVDLTDPDAFCLAWIRRPVGDRGAGARRRCGVERVGDRRRAGGTRRGRGGHRDPRRRAQEIARVELDAHLSATFRARQALLRPRRRHRGRGVPTTGAGGFTALGDRRRRRACASHAAEVARTQEYPVRAEIEAFARSISNGVSLDFTWAYEVQGVTSDAVCRHRRVRWTAPTGASSR